MQCSEDSDSPANKVLLMSFHRFFLIISKQSKTQEALERFQLRLDALHGTLHCGLGSRLLRFISGRQLSLQCLRIAVLTSYKCHMCYKTSNSCSRNLCQCTLSGTELHGFGKQCRLAHQNSLQCVRVCTNIIHCANTAGQGTTQPCGVASEPQVAHRDF